MIARPLATKPVLPGLGCSGAHGYHGSFNANSHGFHGFHGSHGAIGGCALTIECSANFLVIGRSARVGWRRMTLMTQRTQESQLRRQWSVVRCGDRPSEPNKIADRAQNARIRDDFRGFHDAHNADDAADATIRAKPSHWSMTLMTQRTQQSGHCPVAVENVAASLLRAFRRTGTSAPFASSDAGSVGESDARMHPGLS
jgi:hypothetical protein